MIQTGPPGEETQKGQQALAVQCEKSCDRSRDWLVTPEVPLLHLQF